MEDNVSLCVVGRVEGEEWRGFFRTRDVIELIQSRVELI